MSHQTPNKRGRAAEKDVQLDWAKSFEIPDKVISCIVWDPSSLLLICVAIHFISTKARGLLDRIDAEVIVYDLC